MYIKMNVSFNIGEIIHGYTIKSQHGVSQYVADNDTVRILFETDAGSGQNKYRIISYTDIINDRYYRTPHTVMKYEPIVKILSDYLLKKYKNSTVGITI